MPQQNTALSTVIPSNSIQQQYGSSTNNSQQILQMSSNNWTTASGGGYIQGQSVRSTHSGIINSSIGINSATTTNQFPSTVDMNAFKATGSAPIPPIKSSNLSSSSSDSDDSDLSSDSDDSSDSSIDEKSAGNKSVNKLTPQFSVTSSDAGSLRMKIAAIPQNRMNPTKSISTSSLSTNVTNNNLNVKLSKTNNIFSNPTNKKKSTQSTKKAENLSSSSSYCSDYSDDSDEDSDSSSDDDSDDDSDSDDENDKKAKDSKKDKVNTANSNPNNSNNANNNNQQSLSSSTAIISNQQTIQTQSQQSQQQTNLTINRKRTKTKQRPANRNGSTSSGGRTDTSESDSNDELLKEINDEDLAAFLPPDDLNLIDNCGGPPNTNILKPPIDIPSQSVDCASSSDDNLEIPDLVNAAIQRVESGSDTEMGCNKAITSTPSTQYNLSLLRDFVVKTQMLGNTGTSSGGCSNDITNLNNSSNVNGVNSNINNDSSSNKVNELKSEKEIKTESPIPIVNNANSNSDILVNKKKRGRPKKVSSNDNSEIQNNNNKSSNVVAPAIESPDSGILSTPQSPVTRQESPKNNNNNDKKKVNQNVESRNKDIGSSAKVNKLNLASLEKSIYATERVLYPPRGQRKRGPGRPTRSKSVSCLKTEEVLLDPMWKKIDINKKFRRPSTSGYKSDGGNSTICSKKLVAQSGYISDYGSVHYHHSRISTSGYRSDYSTKSRKSGYRSDYSTKAKSCGYRSDCSSIHHRKKVRRKRRSKAIASSSKSVVNEQDILQLACLSLGQTSEESSRDSYTATSTPAPITTTSLISKEISKPFMKTSFKNCITHGIFNENNKSFHFENFNLNRKNSSFLFISNTELNSKYFRSNNKSKVNLTFPSLSGASSSSMLNNHKTLTKLNLEELNKKNSNLNSRQQRLRRSSSVKPRDLIIDKSVKSENMTDSKSLKSRRSYALSRCSSHTTYSRHPFRKRRRKRLKSRSRSESMYKSGSETVNVKYSAEIEDLANSFGEMCKIHMAEKAALAAQKAATNDKLNQQTTSAAAAAAKRITKKRKVSEHHQTAADSPTTNTSGKRRHKKAVTTQSPDDHKLPLKKRHYLLTNGEKADDIKDQKKDDQPSTALIHQEIQSRSEKHKPIFENRAESAKVVTSAKAVTPKKRHLLETPEPIAGEIVSTVKISNSPLTIDCGKTASSTETVTDLSITELIQLKSQTLPKPKSDIITRKKNRLEGLVSKIGGNTLQTTSTSPSASRSPSTTRPSVIRTLGQPINTVVENKTISTPPPGVFEPSVDLELQIPISTISEPSIITKTELLDSPRLLGDDVAQVLKATEDLDDSKKSEKLVETLLNKTSRNLLLKKKRKKINRTGFPTVKKKKKKSGDTSSSLSDSINNGTEDDIKNDSITTLNVSDVGDRVPKEGETADTFIERNTVKPRLSVVSLEKLQGKVQPDMIVGNQEVTKLAVEEPIVPAKRQLRAKLSNNEKTQIKKRERDVSQDSENNNTSKKSKSEIPTVALNENSNDPKNIIKRKEKESRDISSDNEPLINFVNRKSSTSKEASKLAAVSAAAKEEMKENIVKKDEIKLRMSSRRQSFSAEKAKEIIKVNKSSTVVKPIEIDAVTTNKRPLSRSKSRLTEVKAEPLKPKERESIKKHTKIEQVVAPASKRQSLRHESKPKDSKVYHKLVIELPKEKILPECRIVKCDQLVKSADCETELEQDPLPINEGPQSSAHLLSNHSRENSPASTISDRSVKKNPKWKKKFLIAGLLSDFFKDDESGRTRSGKIETNMPATGLLPPPPYCEKYFRQTQIDFQLPYDLWWAQEYSKLPGRDSVPSWNYKKIRTNVYGDVRPNPSTDHQPCSCKPDSGCPDDCLNRLVYTECIPETCPCGDRCQNQKIQKHEYHPGLERYMTENKGWGIRTKQDITKGCFILEYLGEVVTEREFKDRMAARYARDTHHYCLHLDGGLVIDGHRMGSDGRFVNHSCSPNCEIQKWSVNGLFRMALFALRNIKPGEELTYDYNFSLFNPAEGQPCRCDTPQCRGVIGGKSQRIKPIVVEAKVTDAAATTRTGRQRKRQAKKNQLTILNKDGTNVTSLQPPTQKERSIIRNSHCFLIRNLEKIRKLKERSAVVAMQQQTASTATQSLSAQISALRVPRNIKTRGLALVEHDPELEKTARIAGILREICQDLSGYKDGRNVILISKLNIPSKKKTPKYFDVIKRPIDLSQIEENVEKGLYKQLKIFDLDIRRLFENAIKFYGVDSVEGKSASELSMHYAKLKSKYADKFIGILGEQSNETLKDFITIDKNGKGVVMKSDVVEDIIRCLCGLFKDEGLMIQCSRCMVWQHTECTQADTSMDSYLCERCDNRVVDLEIPLNEYTEEGYRYYLSLLRGNLQIRQSDTVYVLRDIPIEPKEKGGIVRKHTYETIGEIDYAECDIFRVERLWKDNNGKRFVFGHHYLRPHETYHEPTRKFYQNEVVRVPLYEVVPIELVMAKCWVLDTNTYCKGRPVDSIEEHVYICELRVDRGAKLFAKISKHPYPTCTKNYAFKKFEQRLKITKTYAPHDLGTLNLKSKKEKTKKDESSVTINLTSGTGGIGSGTSTNTNNTSASTNQKVPRKNSTPIVQLIPPPPKTINEKRGRLESILNKLMGKQLEIHKTPPLDISYLLTGRGARLRRANATIVPI